MAPQLRWYRILLGVASFLAIAFLMARAIAAESAGVAGLWSGTMHAGSADLRLVLHVNAGAGGKLDVALDSVDQGAMGLPGSNAILKDRAFTFAIPSVRGTYVGTLGADGNSIDGTWTQGTPLPLKFVRATVATVPTPEPTPSPMPAKPPVALRDLKPLLDQELAPALKDGVLSKASGGGLVIGVLDRRERSIFSYGTAHPDSIFEIGSITKTFTGLILAQMVVQKQVTLDEPVRPLLPADFLGVPTDSEMTLLDLATHHSGLPRMPDNFEPENPANSISDYGAKQLSEFLIQHGLKKPAGAKFAYSNLGFGLLGFALSQRAGVPYPELLQNEVTGPLHLHDTVIDLSPAQRKRLIQGYDATFNKTGPLDFNALSGAGAIRSTASDMLTYLYANMHPDKYAAGAVPGSPAATLPEAMAIDHQARADVEESGKENQIALAWFIVAKTQSLLHSGGTDGYASFATFNTGRDLAVVALYNRESNPPRFVDQVGQNVTALLAGLPAAPPDFMSKADKKALEHPVFDDSSVSGRYHCRANAFLLPAKENDSFALGSTGDIYATADGKGRLTQGTWEHRIVAPGLNITCKMKLISGTYTVKSDGTGTQNTTWELIKDDSPRACFRFFSAAQMKVHTEPQSITMDKGGRIFYTTTLSPAAVMNAACQREGDE